MKLKGLTKLVLLECVLKYSNTKQVTFKGILVILFSWSLYHLEMKPISPNRSFFPSLLFLFFYDIRVIMGHWLALSHMLESEADISYSYFLELDIFAFICGLQLSYDFGLQKKETHMLLLFLGTPYGFITRYLCY